MEDNQNADAEQDTEEMRGLMVGPSDVESAISGELFVVNEDIGDLSSEREKNAQTTISHAKMTDLRIHFPMLYYLALTAQNEAGISNYLREYVLPLINQSETNDQQLLIENDMGLFLHKTYSAQFPNVQQSSKRKYTFQDKDFKHVFQAANPIRTTIAQHGFIVWEKAETWLKFVKKLRKEFRFQVVKPRDPDTLIKWVTKLCVQRFMLRVLVANKKHDLLKSGVTSESIITRAKGFRQLKLETLTPQTPEQNSKDYSAWLYWQKKLGSTQEIWHKFLKQLVIIGPRHFYLSPVMFSTGGRRGKGTIVRADDMTMPVLLKIINELINSGPSSQSLSSKEQNDMVDVKYEDGTIKKLRGRHIRSFLNRIGIFKRKGRSFEAKAFHKVNRVEAKRFVEHIQKQLVFGSGKNDVVFFDESSLSLFPRRRLQWTVGKYGAARTNFSLQKKSNSIGAYNLFLSCGVIGSQTFLHLMLCKPLHVNLKLFENEFVPHNTVTTKAKLRGTTSSVMHYFMNTSGLPLFGVPDPTLNTDTTKNIKISRCLYHHQNLDPLFDYIAKLRTQQNVDPNIPLYFMMDNAPSHMAQKISANLRSANAKGEWNPAFQFFEQFLIAKVGSLHNHVIFLPKYLPNFNPCERVFAHLKNYINRKAPHNVDTLTEKQLFKLVGQFSNAMNKHTIAKIVHGCKYQLEGWPAHPEYKRIPKHISDDVCNNPDPLYVDKSIEGLQVVCASQNSGLISKYLPFGEKAWHILSKKATLFDPQKPYIVNPFTLYSNEGDSSLQPEDDKKKYFPFYSGYAFDEYLARDEAKYEASINLTNADIVGVNSWIDGTERQMDFDDSPTRERTYVIRDKSALYAYIMLSISTNWKLVPNVFVPSHNKDALVFAFDNDIYVHKRAVVILPKGQAESFLYSRIQHLTTKLFDDCLSRAGPFVKNSVTFFSVKRNNVTNTSTS